MTHEKLKEAFMQGEEREAAKLFQELLRQSVRAGLFAVMAEEVDALCGPRYRPDSQSVYQRAGSEIGVAYLDGGKESIRRPRVRHETGGEVRLVPGKKPLRGQPALGNRRGRDAPERSRAGHGGDFRTQPGRLR